MDLLYDDESCGEIVIIANREEIYQLKEIVEKCDGKIEGRGIIVSPYPLTLKRIVAAYQDIPAVTIRVKDGELVISGNTHIMTKFAKSISSIAKQPGEHLHIEFNPDIWDVDKESIPLILEHIE